MASVSLKSAFLLGRETAKNSIVAPALAARSAQPAAAFVRHYSEAVHDHFQKPRNVGSFDTKDPSVG